MSDGIVIVFALLPDIALIGAFDSGRRGMLVAALAVTQSPPVENAPR